MAIPFYPPEQPPTILKVAGRLDIEWHMNTTFKILLPLYHLNKITGVWTRKNNNISPFTPTDDDIANAKVKMVVKDKPYSTNPTDSDAILTAYGDIEVITDPVDDRIVECFAKIEAPHTDMFIEPGRYYYSIDIYWMDGEFMREVNKLAQGKFIVHPNTINSLNSITDRIGNLENKPVEIGDNHASS